MTIAEKVADRYTHSKIVTATIIYKDCGGIEWGWFADNVQRMHLKPMKPLVYRGLGTVWLESNGTRCFAPDGAEIFVLGPVQEWVSRNRDRVEGAWLRYCRAKDWLRCNATRTEIVLYPGPSEIRRSLCDVEGVEPCDWHLDPSKDLVQVEYRLNRIIWKGPDDGSGIEAEFGRVRDYRDGSRLKKISIFIGDLNAGHRVNIITGYHGGKLSGHCYFKVASLR